MGGLLKQYLWVANILVILLCTYFAAKITNVYIGKAMEVNRTIGVLKKGGVTGSVRNIHSKSDYDVILKRNMFDSSEAPPPDVKEASKTEEYKYKPGDKAVKTSLPVKVFSVLVVGAGKDNRSNATIAMGKEVDVYTVKGDKTFSPGVLLVQIKPTRIEFVNKGRLEYASLDDEAGSSIFGPPGDLTASKTTEKETVKRDTTTVAEEDGKTLIDQREIDNALANLDRLYTEIRAVPNFQNGKVTGMKVLSVKPGSVFAKLGIKRGDILSRINGIELDVKRGFDIFNQLKNQKNFTLDLVRGGSSRTMEYEIR